MHQNYPVRFLVQKFTSIVGEGNGAWLSIRMFNGKKEAEELVKTMSAEKTRVVEVVCESAK